MKNWKAVVPVAIMVAVLIAVSPFAANFLHYCIDDITVTDEYNNFVDKNETFYDNSFFNGIDISGLTTTEALELIRADFENRSIKVLSQDDSLTDTFSYKSINRNFRDLILALSKAYDGQTLTKKEYINGAKRKDYALDLTKDLDFKNADISGLKCLDSKLVTPSKDAYVEVNKETGELDYVKEVYGNELKDGVLLEKLQAAVSEGSSEVTILSEDYITPEIVYGDEALEKEKAFYETLLDKSITMNVCGVRVDLLPKDTVTLFDFEVGDETDDEAIEAYVKGLKSRYDTYKKTRSFATSTGEIVSVVAGDYGWSINTDKTVEKLKEVLLSEKKDEAMECVYNIKGQRPAINEISNTYVEIDLRDQKIWMYVNGARILEDDITSGEVTVPNSGTNTGTFSLAYKMTNATLKGPTWNDFVYYWMPYDLENAVGMHDATWRTDEEFGGRNRYGNGSHGCVNMRVNAAATVYENIEMDTPIVVWE